MNDDTPELDETSRLACGRWVEDVWDNLGQPPTGHELDCPHCQDARARLSRLREATEQLRAEDAGDQALRPSAAVKNNVMAIARTEVRRSRRLPLTGATRSAAERRADAGAERPQDRTPALWISEHAVAAVIRSAADSVTGARARRCRIELSPAEAGAAALPDSPVAVDVNLRLAVRRSTDIRTAQAAVRAAVITAVESFVGLVVSRVDLAVEDVLDD